MLTSGSVFSSLLLLSVPCLSFILTAKSEMTDHSLGVYHIGEEYARS